MHCYFYSCISLLAVLLVVRSIKVISFTTRSILIRHFIGLLAPLWLSIDTIRVANIGLSFKLVPRFLSLELNLLFIDICCLWGQCSHSLLVCMEKSMCTTIHEHLGYQQDAAMDGQDVSRLVAIAFMEYANLDIRIADYRHLTTYFGGAIKQSYCTKFPIDETSKHSSAIVARHYANCSNDHIFMDIQQMYTYKLATMAWHYLWQFNGSPVKPPPLGISTIEIPTFIDQPNNHCPFQFKCACLFTLLMYPITQTTTQLAILPPPQDQTHEVRLLWAFRRLGHEHWTCKEQGLVVTLVLENKIDLLVVMPTRHDKSVVFMIPPMVTNQTIIVMVPFTILINRHEVDTSWVGLRYATYGMDTITFDDPPSILFVSVERATTPRFVELAHTLNHL